MTAEKLPVFRKVNNELFRIPNDERNPKRRYALISDATGQYHREFTDEEEKERDAEEAQWEAGRRQRENEQKQRQKEADEFRAGLIYSSRIVAYIDVLGWRQAIERSRNNVEYVKQLGNALTIIKGKVSYASYLRETLQWPTDPQVTQFSDTILLSYAASKEHSSMLESSLLGDLWSIIRSMLGLGFFVRGGIVLGDLIHKDSIAYGPALEKAWKLEKEIAAWPRIVLDPTLAQIWSREIPVTNQNGTLIDVQRHWKVGADNYVFYDFLRPWPGAGQTSTTDHRQFMQQVRDEILANMDANRNNSSVMKKYEFLTEYFNSACDEYPDCQIPKLDCHGLGHLNP